MAGWLAGVNTEWLMADVNVGCGCTDVCGRWRLDMIRRAPASLIDLEVGDALADADELAEGLLWGRV